MHYALSELWVLRLKSSYEHFVSNGSVLLRGSLCLCGGIFDAGSSPQRSAETHKR